MVTRMSTEDTKKWIGNNLEKIIKSKGMTKRAVSNMTGIPYSSLNSKIKGYRSFDVIELLAIAETVDAPPAIFLPPEFSNDSALAKGESK
jgi:predicted transcriptional regulator